MRSLSDKINDLAKDIRELASVTGGVGWDRGVDEFLTNPTDLGAKPIPRNEWTRALLTAVALSKDFPYLDPPTPGADPEGFVWLTWRQGDGRGLALELRKDAYKWTQADPAGKKTIQSDSLNDVAEAMRSVFVRG